VGFFMGGRTKTMTTPHRQGSAANGAILAKPAQTRNNLTFSCFLYLILFKEVNLLKDFRLTLKKEGIYAGRK
jgi:hypothetical protein